MNSTSSNGGYGRILERLSLVERDGFAGLSRSLVEDKRPKVSANPTPHLASVFEVLTSMEGRTVDLIGKRGEGYA